MTLEEDTEVITLHRVIAVLDPPVRSRLFAWARAVAKGGIRLLGVPVWLPNVPETTAELADEANLKIGVLGGFTSEHLSMAIAGGAHFVVLPICNPDLVKMAKDRGLTVIAGGFTATEIDQAAQAGADFVTVFPVGELGGPSYIKTLAHQCRHVAL